MQRSTLLYQVGPSWPLQWVTAEASRESLTVLRQVCELDAIVGEHGMDAVRTASMSASRNAAAARIFRLFDTLDHANFEVQSMGNEQVELVFGRPDLGQVDMEEADRIRVDFFLLGLSPSTSGNRLTHDAPGIEKETSG